MFAPDDGRVVFAGESLPRLLATYGLYECLRYRRLVRLGCRIVNRAVVSGAAGDAVLWAVKKTAFKHFCGGETLEESVRTAECLGSRGVRCIFDWSVEEDHSPAAWDSNGAKKAETMRLAKCAMGHSAAFMPVKLTALMSPTLLERITAQESLLRRSTPGCPVQEVDAQLREGLGPEDIQLLDASLLRLRLLCVAARECDVSLLLDAEQSGRQPAVHFIARHLQREFNPRGSPPVVFDTLQMYLRDSPARLEESLFAATKGQYNFAVKLVRGAYIQQEAPTLIHPTKADTDAAFNTGCARVLASISPANVAAGTGSSLMVATHNRASLEKAVCEMSARGLCRSDSRVHFAQILGMVDNLSFGLRVAGYNVSKLVVFGEVRQVLPWLLRRVEENQDAFGAQMAEQGVLRAEIHRRLTMRISS